MSDIFEITYINPKEAFFYRTEGGMLVVEMAQVSYPEVIIRRTYPMSRPYEYLSVWTKDDKELGVIRHLDELDESSKHEIAVELKLRYVIPIVTHIHSIKEEPGIWSIKVKTDRGELELLMRNIHEHIQLIDSNRIIITDMEGKRCEIEDIQSLDQSSQKQLRKII
ncbi:DUF1854 domain-containing protein [Sutcliffiella halmapala]|uniref:DUF1854 domain-containing protein n=1 Tax=Sutcliffiella halmapala TaxID=79882 RepID=UPI000995508A|nr:DUF1854 domain-containing protein [Sutcliffiella halmapala]